MADGFLGRWSQRKQEIREGKKPAEPAKPAESQHGHQPPAPHLAPQVVTNPAPGAGVPAAVAAPGTPPGQTAAQQPPPPTLADAQALTPASDFKPFMSPGVSADVKNLAMKKLFADPHFNIMDGLDIYIDDYSQPNPLPLSMMRKMNSAKFLNLFDDEDEDGKKKQPPQALRDDPSTVTDPNVAQSADPLPAQTHPQNLSQDHAHTDLRLQQDHAAGPPGPGRGAE